MTFFDDFLECKCIISLNAYCAIISPPSRPIFDVTAMAFSLRYVLDKRSQNEFFSLSSLCKWAKYCLNFVNKKFEIRDVLCGAFTHRLTRIFIFCDAFSRIALYTSDSTKVRHLEVGEAFKHVV